MIVWYRNFATFWTNPAFCTWNFVCWIVRTIYAYDFIFPEAWTPSSLPTDDVPFVRSVSGACMEDLLSSPFGLTRIRSSQEVYSKTRHPLRNPPTMPASIGRCQYRRCCSPTSSSSPTRSFPHIGERESAERKKQRKNHSRLDYTIEIRLLSIECVSLIGQYTLKCQPGTALYTNFMLAL